MVKFQRNFTTPEQSKHLLDLGLPEDSADCYFHENRRKELDRIFHCGDKTYSEQLTTAFTYEIAPNMLPCWSVGRLFEIIAICLPAEIIISTDEYPYVLDNILQVIEDCIEEFDFSKLEEQ